VTELQIQRCTSCAAHWFPDRLRCPDCGGALQHTGAGEGRVEEQTTLRRTSGARLASVRLDAGPVVIARRADDARATRVRLTVTDDGAIWTT
jgi:uncharacterized OB-fold protein